MAKYTHKLTDVKVRNTKETGLHGDGAGLYLRITSAGTKGWIFRFKRGLKENGKPKSYDMGLGTYPAVTLSAARDKAHQARKALAEGANPLEEKKARVAAPVASKHVVTFAEAAERYIAAHEGNWKNAKHRQQWKNTLSDYAGPIIGQRDVAAISTDDVLRILEPIWKEKPETASRLRGRIEIVLDWAKVRKLREGENPARCSPISTRPGRSTARLHYGKWLSMSLRPSSRRA
jgi:hypothetical protein